MCVRVWRGSAHHPDGASSSSSSSISLSVFERAGVGSSPARVVSCFASRHRSRRSMQRSNARRVFVPPPPKSKHTPHQCTPPQSRLFDTLSSNPIPEQNRRQQHRQQKPNQNKGSKPIMQALRGPAQGLRAAPLAKPRRSIVISSANLQVRTTERQRDWTSVMGEGVLLQHSPTPTNQRQESAASASPQHQTALSRFVCWRSMQCIGLARPRGDEGRPIGGSRRWRALARERGGRERAAQRARARKKSRGW